MKGKVRGGLSDSRVSLGDCVVEPIAISWHGEQGDAVMMSGTETTSTSSGESERPCRHPRESGLSRALKWEGDFYAFTATRPQWMLLPEGLPAPPVSPAAASTPPGATGGLFADRLPR